MPNARQSSSLHNVFIRNAPAKRALNRDYESRTLLRGDCHESSRNSPRGIRSAASLNAANGVTFGASRLPLNLAGDKQGRASYTAPRSTHKQGSAPAAGSLHTRPAKPGGHNDTTSHITPGTPALRPDSASYSQSSGMPQSRGVTPHPDNLQTPERYEKRLLRSVRQDKDRFSSDRAASLQPAAVKEFTRSQATSRKSARLQKENGDHRRTVPVQVWVSPLVKDELTRIASAESLSLSAAGAALLERGLQQNVDMQYGALLRPIIEDAIAKKMAGIVTRLTWLLVRIAYDSGQTRSIVTNILGRQQGMTQPLLKTILEESSRSAKGNIMRRTPQITTLISSVEQWMLEESRAEKQAKTHD